MKKLFFNAVNSLFSTMAGAVVGGDHVLEGIQEHNYVKIGVGVLIVLWGAITNEQGSSKPF